MVVPANDARSVAVPIVPKRIGEIEIEVSSILQVKIDGAYMNSAGDAVRRQLLVVVRVITNLARHTYGCRTGRCVRLPSEMPESIFTLVFSAGFIQHTEFANFNIHCKVFKK